MEGILRNPRHRDRFRAVEFVAKHAEQAEGNLSAVQATELARRLAEIVVRFVPDPDQRRAIVAEFEAVLGTLPWHASINGGRLNSHHSGISNRS